MRNKAACLALTITCQCEKQELGLWIEETAGAKCWLKVPNDFKTRGVGDILFAVFEGIMGFARKFPSTPRRSSSDRG